MNRRTTTKESRQQTQLPELAIIAGTRCRQWMTLVALGGACLAMASATGATREYNEQYRPQYHFSPPRHWMNVSTPVTPYFPP